MKFIEEHTSPVSSSIFFLLYNIVKNLTDWYTANHAARSFTNSVIINGSVGSLHAFRALCGNKLLLGRILRLYVRSTVIHRHMYANFSFPLKNMTTRNNPFNMREIQTVEFTHQGVQILHIRTAISTFILITSLSGSFFNAVATPPYARARYFYIAHPVRIRNSLRRA